VPRFVVIERGDPARARALAADRAQQSDGVVVLGDWPVHVLPGTVVHGTITDAASAAQAVLAAVRGADLVLLAAAEREVIDQLCDDLRRLGPLDHRIGDAAPVEPDLGPDERALLARLVGGATLGEAAKALHLSRRTADRRLAAARRALGAASTSEALVLARRRGIEPV
jgi:DNA-binding NarL/FixJ family response regulator